MIIKFILAQQHAQKPYKTFWGGISYKVYLG